LGYNSDIASLFAQSSIVVLPSYREGLPKVLVEAAACGRAVVTTDVPGCRDAIVPNETGLLVPPRDVVLLADAIQYLLENPERCKEMGQAGRKLAEREFAIERIVSAHLKVYRNLLETAA
jgi:glycosyltransferase involved in cell wall biosynthesis